MDEIINTLFPKVLAQTSDAISQPTFGEILSGSSGSTTSTVLINWENPALKVGDRFKIRVEVDTGSISISEYRVAVKFDTSALSVIDQDVTTPGTQVKFLDSVFTIDDPGLQNVTENGVINVIATAPQGEEYQLDKEVIEVEFQVQKTGASLVQIFQGSNGTQLTKLNGQPIQYSINEISINATSNTGVTPTEPTTPDPEPEEPNPGIEVPTGGTTIIPNTAISDGPGFIFSFIIGFLLIVVGISLRRQKSKDKELVD